MQMPSPDNTVMQMAKASGVDGSVEVMVKLLPREGLLSDFPQDLVAHNLANIIRKYAGELQSNLSSMFGIAPTESTCIPDGQASDSSTLTYLECSCSSSCSDCTESPCESELSEWCSGCFNNSKDASAEVGQPRMEIIGERMTPRGREFRVTWRDSWIREKRMEEGQRAIRTWQEMNLADFY